MKIIDFGSATPLTGSLVPPLSGFVAGTTQYMAPELFQDHIQDLSKTDTWALGVVLLNMVNGCQFKFASGKEFL